MSVENLKLWLKGEYVSPQDFKESLEKVIKQAEQYKSALEDIAYHVSEPIGEHENYENTVYEFIDISKRALGY